MCDPGNVVNGVTDAISGALGTDGGGGGLLGGVSDELGTSGKKGVGLLQDPVLSAAVIAAAAYYGIPPEMVTTTEISGATNAGVVSASDAAALSNLSVGANVSSGVGLTAGSGTTGLIAGGGAGMAGASTIGSTAATIAAASSLGGGSSSLFSNLSGAGSVIQGLAGLSQIGSVGGSAAANAADPFASQRPQYQAMLSQLMANPSSIQNLPTYQAGLQAVERTDAAEGFTGGGKAATDIASLGSTAFTNEATLLSTLAGATSGNTGAAGQALSSGATNQAQLLGTSLNSLAYGMSLIGN